MELLGLRSNGVHDLEEGLPFAVYTVGTEMQQPITRVEGFSAGQLFLTFSGVGRFRLIGQNKPDILEPGSLLYIPAGVPNEYMPVGDEPWFVGYVTFVEREPGLLAAWGFGRDPFIRRIGNPDLLYARIETIWSLSGPQHEPWKATEALFAFCLELKKQLHEHPPGLAKPTVTVSANSSVIPHPAVESAVRFLHDHLERSLTVRELADYAGYSQKQLTRLFRRHLGQTPLQYLLQLRLRTAALLLHEHPGLTIRQAAAYVGMEPVYFTRLFRRAYGITPSESRVTPS